MPLQLSSSSGNPTWSSYLRAQVVVEGAFRYAVIPRRRSVLSAPLLTLAPMGSTESHDREGYR